MKPQIVFDSANQHPIVSIILLDWSSRESLHTLEYLNNQCIPREQFEILWIEYYDRVSPQIQEGLRKYAAEGRSPLLDRWIIMNMPKNIHYHKHLMYNIGILACRGRIVCICDSDAIFTPTFVVNILENFATERESVFHIDEIRNSDHRFYPFNYPSINEVVGPGSINWVNGKSGGILDNSDSKLYSRNYGACMCAMREDLIAIGGADEHRDFIGHICGPYDLTFRLINAGKKEIWHELEYIYHVWHPGQGGTGEYIGPNEYNMASRAMEARRSGRILPYDENPGISAFRRGEKREFTTEELFSYTIREERVKDWVV